MNEIRKTGKLGLAAILAAFVGLMAVPLPNIFANPAPVSLETADDFAILAGSTVTNTGPSVITGDLGLSPGSAVTGFPPGLLIGSTHIGDDVATQAKTDLTTAYNDVEGRTPATAVSADLGGQTLTAGVYNSESSLGLTGTVTLDAENDPDAIFIFQAGTTLTAASSSQVDLIRGAQVCNVYWQIGSSATIGTDSDFKGNILADQSITLTTGATLDGRALARIGAVTLDSNIITKSECATPPTYSLTLYEGSTPSDGAIDQGETVKAVAETTDSDVTAVTFSWTAPNGTTVRTVTNPISGGQAEDSLIPDSPGPWVVDVDFGNDVILTDTVIVSVFVIPESPLGTIALLGSSVAALGAYFAIRKMRSGGSNSGALGGKGLGL